MAHYRTALQWRAGKGSMGCAQCTVLAAASLPTATPRPSSTPRSDIVPLGQLKSSFNYSTVDKRVLNLENVVNDDDNIKQVRRRLVGLSCKVSGGCS